MGTVSSEPLTLSLSDAIAQGLEHNLGVLTASDVMESARGARWRALSELLPNVHARVSETRQKTNLETFGLTLPGVPTLVGPFNVFDARVSVSQSVFDVAHIAGAQAESQRLEATVQSYKNARDLVVLATANAYLQVLAATSRADSARAQLDTARALFNQAADQRQSGLAAGIDVVRAEVQLSTERQRAMAAANNLEKAKLQLARVIGLPTGQPITMRDELPYRPQPHLTLDAALDVAMRSRSDYLSALALVRAAELSRKAALGESLPSLRVYADYGTIGLTAPTARGTFTVAAVADIPVFQGGRTHGHLLEADAELRNRSHVADDLKASIQFEVRTAFLDLQTTNELVQVAAHARELATNELTQARDRFAAGVADNIDVIHAQEAVALANEQYTSALYEFNLAKATVARAMGVAETHIQNYLGDRQ
jgi:outer membrane protein TolC